MAVQVTFLRERIEVGRGKGESCMKRMLVDWRGAGEEGEKAGARLERSLQQGGRWERGGGEGKVEVTEEEV
jgi:hypothetical protein